MSETTGAEMTERQCSHWNDRLDPQGRTMLRPVQCTREAGHDGLHLCGDTSWTEQLGFRAEET